MNEFTDFDNQGDVRVLNADTLESSLFDVVSKSFPDMVIKVVQKVESTDRKCTVRHSATQVGRNQRHVHSTEGVCFW